jgi:hypothetical protein
MPAIAETTGFPPKDVTVMLRLEGLVAFIASLYAYQALGGNWWIFAVLILAPDLAMLGLLRGQVFGARLYNAAHTYTVPALLGALAYAAGAAWLLPLAVIWIAHIGLDRALGYGLKYPGLDHHTHLGLIGKAKRKAQKLADAR